MSNRISYIDSLKGLAILLMVMGHVIAYQFPNYPEVALTSNPPVTMILFRIIYSFHMPLLMFCSGLFALRIREYTWKAVGQTLWKRVYSLLLPFLCSGFIVNQIRPTLDYYWFLSTLFWFIVVVISIDGLCSLLPKYSQVVSTCLIIVSAILVHLYYHKFFAYEYLPLIDIGHWRQFPFFCMGVICGRYDLCERWFAKNWVYTGALLLFGILTYWITIKGYHIPKQNITWCILPISAIVASVYLFKEGLSGMSKLEMYLQDIGRHSLEIYIIHLFFCSDLRLLANMCSSMRMSRVGVQFSLFKSQLLLYQPS